MGPNMDESEIHHIAHLARLRLNDQETAQYTHQLAAIISYMDKLRELNVEGVEPTAHPLPLSNVLADDQPVEPFDVDQALQNAPSHRDAYFSVPRVLDPGSGI
ncbi:MAG: Asp-tRNA(Asn)/Glu-tRNA(Gln) amidotransferase subunit GatC [Gammaproteobacteria bacterium]|nr:Asp-tRNA(Asn)/Glu-tRNA(Gln) amidotransferase subunit GatC [Gammaproteobacteria bacterium]